MKLSKNKKQALRLSAITTGSSILSRIVSFPVVIIVAHTLGPALLGGLKIFNLINTYAGYNHLGLLQALTRQVPIALGKKDDLDAKLIQDTVFSVNFLVTFFSIALLWLLFWTGTDFKGLLNPFRLIILTITLAFNRLDSYLHCYMKAMGEFSLITKRTVILEWISPFLLVGLVMLWRLDGVLLAAMLSPIIGTFIYLSSQKIQCPNWSLSWGKTSSLISIGAKVFVNRIADSFFATIDTTIIAVLMTVKDVGLFGFALGIVMTSTSLSTIFNTMLYRNLLMIKGKHGLNKGLHFMRPYLLNPMVGLLLLSTTFIVLLFFIVSSVVKLFLQEYSPALDCLLILAIGQIFFLGSKIPSICLNVMDQLGLRFWFTVIFFAINAILDIILIKSGYGIVGAAWASTICFCLYGTLITCWVHQRVYGSISKSFVFAGKPFIITWVAYIMMLNLQSKQLISFDIGSHVMHQFVLALGDAAIKAILVSGTVILAYLIAFRQQRLANECWAAALFLAKEFKKKFVPEKILMNG